MGRRQEAVILHGVAGLGDVPAGDRVGHPHEHVAEEVPHEHGHDQTGGDVPELATIAGATPASADITIFNTLPPNA